MQTESAQTCHKLPQKQVNFLSVLLKSSTIAQACEKSGTAERSARRWLAEDEAFQAAYRSAKEQTVDQAILLLTAGAHAAVTVLLKVAQDGSSSAPAKVAAAGKILDFVFKSREHDDLAARLEAIEKRLAILAATEPAPSRNGRSYERV